MEPHYCRASTSELYLEPQWNSHVAVYKQRIVQCGEKGYRTLNKDEKQAYMRPHIIFAAFRN
jgi:hypothetical protein